MAEGPIIPPRRVLFGVDRFLANPSPAREWRRVGLVTNDAARLATAPQRLSRDALLQAGVPLVRLFGPEHGLGASAADGEPVNDDRDALTGLPVVSLYGERMRPAAEHLADLDVVLFDIPDVGARFYTYAWTLWHVLHACAEHRVTLVVLDRPNPLGGVIDAVEGPLLQPSCRSFIGEDDIPVRHGLTLGELARLWQREHCPSADLEVITCEGWDASRAWPATGLEWVPTSPAMPRYDSAIWYPGTCLFEGTNVSVGRGTEAPFATIGAPWLDAERVARALQLPGVQLDACVFTPTQAPWAGVVCRGIRLSLATATDPAALVARTVRPVALGLTLLAAIAAHHEAFAWARYPTAANPEGHDHFARLVGRDDIGAQIVTVTREGAAARDAHIAEWTATGAWRERVADVLLYPRG